jgi:broad specificity phosphatase PhoE
VAEEEASAAEAAAAEAARCAEFLSAGAVFASPLTRAVETALLTLEGHPYFAAPNAALHLTRAAREVEFMRVAHAGLALLSWIVFFSSRAHSLHLLFI